MANLRFYIDVNRQEDNFQISEGVIDCVSRAEKLRGKDISYFSERFYEEGFGDKDYLVLYSLKHFNVEPNMIIDLPPALSNITDYLIHSLKNIKNRAKGIF